MASVPIILFGSPPIRFAYAGSNQWLEFPPVDPLCPDAPRLYDNVVFCAPPGSPRACLCASALGLPHAINCPGAERKDEE